MAVFYAQKTRKFRQLFWVVLFGQDFAIMGAVS